MSLNTGSLVRRETSILGMQQDSCMPSPKIWQPTYQLTGEFIYSKMCSLAFK